MVVLLVCGFDGNQKGDSSGTRPTTFPGSLHLLVEYMIIASRVFLLLPFLEVIEDTETLEAVFKKPSDGRKEGRKEGRKTETHVHCSSIHFQSSAHDVLGIDSASQSKKFLVIKITWFRTRSRYNLEIDPSSFPCDA